MVRWWAAVVALTAIQSGAFAAGEDQPEPLRVRPKTTQIDDLVEVPFDADHAPPMIDVLINAKGPFRMAVDTGARSVILDDDVATALGMGARRTVEMQLPGGEKPTKEQAVSIGSIVIGDAMFSDFEGIVIDYDMVYGGTRQRDGTIGFPLFQDCLLTIDYARGVVRLEMGELPMFNDNNILSFMKDAGVPTIEAEIQLMPHRFAVDTGRASALTLPDWLREKVKLLDRDGRSRRAVMSDAPEDGRGAKADSTLRIGYYRLVEPPVHFVAQEAAIGHDSLRHFALTFDSKNERVRFEREDNAPIDFLPPPRFGLYFRREGAKFRVTKIIPDSPAGKIGIQVNDMIVNIDGKPSGNFTEGALRNLFATANTVAMQLEREGMPYILRLYAEER